MNPSGIDRIWFFTWTTYGTWLPGDVRAVFVSPKFEGHRTERRSNTPGEPYDSGRVSLLGLAEANLVGDCVRLTSSQAAIVRVQFNQTARYRDWWILAGAIMANHVHLVVGAPGDPDPASMLRDFKSYASRALNDQFPRPKSGTWWTRARIEEKNHRLGEPGNPPPLCPGPA